MKSWVWLVCGAMGLWLVALYPGWLLAGEQALLQSTTAVLLCLIPALATFYWAIRSGNSPEKQLLATLGGSGIRVFTVVVAGFALYLTWPEVFNDFFWVWIAIFYLFLLALETFLLVKAKQKGTVS
jgi:hypothetical protein